MGVIIGVDVGGSTMSGGLVTPEGDVVSSLHVATRERGDGTAAETLLTLIARLASGAAARGFSIDGVGIGLPGLVHAERGMMTGASNLVPEFAGVPLSERIQTQIGVAAFVDNDVNALTLGEWMFGSHREVRSLVVLAIGSGVGGGMMLDGRLVRGRNGYAGEWGHVSIDFRGPPCVCGGRGCFCVYIGGQHLALEAQDRVQREPGSALLALANGDRLAITAEMIFRASRAGDPLARGMVDRACRALGAGLAVLVNGLNPEVVLVTGGVVASLLPLEREIRQRAAEYALTEPLTGTRIQLVAGDKSRSMRGAAALVLYERARRRGDGNGAERTARSAAPVATVER